MRVRAVLSCFPSPIVAREHEKVKQYIIINWRKTPCPLIWQTRPPHADCGDNVIVINAGKAILTGNKMEQKYYRTHSGWIGGLKETPYRILMQEKPDVAMRVAVKGMMPKNTIARDAMKRLHIYADANYEQQAQKPVVLD